MRTGYFVVLAGRSFISMKPCAHPVTIEHATAVDLAWKPRADRNVTAGRIASRHHALSPAAAVQVRIYQPTPGLKTAQMHDAAFCGARRILVDRRAAQLSAGALPGRP